MCSRSLFFLLCNPMSSSTASTKERSWLCSFIQQLIFPSGFPYSQNKVAFDSLFLNLSIIFNLSVTFNFFDCRHCSTFLFLINVYYSYSTAVLKTYRLQQFSAVQQVKGLTCELYCCSCLSQIEYSLNVAVSTSTVTPS